MKKRYNFCIYLIEPDSNLAKIVPTGGDASQLVTNKTIKNCNMCITCASLEGGVFNDGYNNISMWLELPLQKKFDM